jgi:hypothetical protein
VTSPGFGSPRNVVMEMRPFGSIFPFSSSAWNAVGSFGSFARRPDA